jgi:hypothetical protein
MSTNITLKRSSVQGKVPLVGDLALGEIALNTYDGKLFIKKNVSGSESIVEVAKGTDLSLTSNSSTVSINSDTGTDATILAANSTTAGVLTANAQTIAGAKAFTGKTTTGDITTSYNQLTINGGHVFDGDNDYGITINSFEPAITLIDRSTSAGSVQLFGTNNGGLWIVGDTLNDGTIGHTTNTTDFLVARFEPINTIFYTSGTESMRIANTGNVGIGSTSPSAKLEVNTGSSAAYFTRTAGDTGVTGTTFGIGTASTTTRLGSSGDLLFVVGAVGTAALSQTERMRITANGNVGIGTSSPTEVLHVAGGNILVGTDSGDAFNAKSKIRIQGTADEYIQIKSDGTGQVGLLFGDTTDDFTAGILSLQTAGNDLKFFANNATRMTIDSSGNVGIGTTTPSTALQVNGTITATSFGGASTTGDFGYNGTAASTTNISTGATTTDTTKTLNIGTGGAAGSTTNINIGSANGGSTKILTPSAIVPGNLSVGADILATTGPILTLGTLVGGGTGYMNGTHTNQLLTGGTGLYMLATVVVALGVVTGITSTWGGHRYTAADVLTVPSLTTTLATTAASGTGTTATLTFAAQAAAPFQVGSQIIVAGVTPVGYNGTFTVTACTTTTVSYANATTGAQTVAGTVKMGAALTSSTIPVATIQGSDIYVSSTISDSIGARIRLESNDTSTAIGQEYGAIVFGSRDASSQGSGDVGLIRGVAVNTSGGSELQFWTAENGTSPNLSAVVTSGGNFRMYNATGTFYSELSNAPTVNRTVTIPDVSGTALIAQAAAAAGYFDTSATTPTASNRLNYGGYIYPTALNLTGQGETATAATHYFVETGSDGFVRPKTLANVRTEVVTNAAVSSAFGTSPTFTTSIVAGSATMALFDTTATTINFAGAATTGNFGYDGTASSTTNLSVGAVAEGFAKSINIGTGGNGATVTNITIGANDNGGLTINSANVNALNALIVANAMEAGDGSFGILSLGGTAVTATAAELNKLDGVTATTAELNFVDGVTSAIQTQFASKFAGINVRTFITTGTGTYTPTTGMRHCLVFATGGGGGGGGSDCIDTTAASAGAGGGAGGTAIKYYTAAQIGVNATFAIGAGGTAGSASGGDGGSGGTTTFTPSGGGAELSAPGGTLGNGGGQPSGGIATAAGVGGTPTGGDFNIPGGDGQGGAGHFDASFAIAGSGGNSFWGGGGRGAARTSTTSAGQAGGINTGAGGGGSATVDSTSGSVGGAGGAGVIFILEFINA